MPRNDIEERKLALEERRLRLESRNSIITLCAGILVPLAITVSGFIYQSSQKERIATEYIRMAVDILRTDPKITGLPLRGWAVQVLSQGTAIPLNKEQQAILQEIPLPQETKPK